MNDYPRTAAFLFSICVFQVCAGCAHGDPPETVALIKKHVSPKAVKTLKDENGRQRIFSLSLPNNRSALEILPHLAKLERLTTLRIAYEGITDDDLELLPRLPKLRTFALRSKHVTDGGLKHLAGMKELRRLTLAETKIRGPGMAYLKDSSKLEWLDLIATPLDDSAIPHIVKNFRRLRRFDFPHSNVTEKGLIQLADLHWLTTIGPPDEIAGPRNDPNRKKRLHELLSKYVKAYKESKRKARAAGEDVPPDHVGPFGLIE